MGRVTDMTDATLLAEYNRPAPKNRGTYKVERIRANRAVKVREELERRGLIDPLADRLAIVATLTKQEAP